MSTTPPGSPPAGGNIQDRFNHLESVIQMTMNQNEALRQQLAALQAAQGQGSPSSDRLGMGEPGVLDTRVLGKPEKFSGDETRWGLWSFVMRCYAGAMSSSIDEPDRRYGPR